MTPRLATALAFLAALLTPFRRELFVGDETKYAEVVREMRATGEWFLPALQGVPFTHKPPLHFWTIELLTYLFGLYSTWSFVLPSLIAFALLLFLMRRIGGDTAAFVTATSLLVWGSAQTARMDVAFTTLITLGIWMLIRFLEGERNALLVAATALGIATLVKGPMAPVIALVFFLLEAWHRRGVPRGPYLIALVLLAAIPLVWFVPAMRLGGAAYTHDVLQKQIAGRAVASWVHASPPWYYLLHAPGVLFPWFLLLAAALIHRWREQRTNLHWLLAVLVPYSLMSSKLDVYMMALVPPAALIVSSFIASGEPLVRRLNMAMLVLLALIAVALPFVPLRDAPPLTVPAVALGVAAVAGLFFSRDAIRSSVALGLAPIAMLLTVAIALMPWINENTSTRPLVRTLAAQNVAPEAIALYTCPYLWTHTMPRALERVRYVRADNVGRPEVIVTARRHAAEIAPALAGYRKTTEVRMIGKWFDVYRR
jgi:4-amino-4-deoxy-L-arabinose transferase-like glycosyltransferase